MTAAADPLRGTAGARLDRFELLRLAGSALDRAGVVWSIVGGVDPVTGAIATDAEIVADAVSLAEIAAALRASDRLEIVHAVASRPDAAAFWLADPSALAAGAAVGDESDLLQLDAALSIAWNGRGVRARDLFGLPPKRAAGLPYAPAGQRLLYGLAKAAARGALPATEARALAALFETDPDSCYGAFGRPGANRLCRAALPLIDRSREGDLHRAVATAAADTGAAGRLYPVRAEWRRRAARALRPSGLCVALLGPDGTGKSTIAAAVGRATRSLFAAVDTLHLRPFFGQPGTLGAAPSADPHGAPPRNAPATLAKLVYWWADYTIGFVVAVTPRLIRNRLVLFDRYFDDLLVDPRRYRVARAGGLAALVGRTIVRPQLTVILDAPADVIHARKAELPVAEIERLRGAYLDLAKRLPEAVVIDANRPPETVAADVVAHIRRALRRRAAERRVG